MGNENHQHHHFYYQKSTFLPMLCSRPSIKQVTLPRFKDPSAPSANDPLSPRISCMGQVKRNNKIAGIPPSHRLTFTNKTNTPSPGVKYSKLKKLFSGKNFIISTPKTTTAAATTTNTISTCRSRQQVSDVPKNQKCLKSENNNNVVCMRSIEDMDPPLPVVKRVPKLEKGKELDSLWRRRSGTGKPELKSLQLQQIHHPRICHQPPTV